MNGGLLRCVCVGVGVGVRSGGGDSCDSYWLDLSTHLNE